MTELRTLLRDAGYVAVGLGVIAFQRGQVQRRELEKQLADVSTSLEDVKKLVEERVNALGEQVDLSVDDIEQRLTVVLDEVRSRLPEQAREAFDTAVGAAKDATGQLLDLVRPANAA